MTTGEQLSWLLVDMISIKSLGLNKEGCIFYSYGQLHIHLLSFPDTFIMNNGKRRDRSWLRTWEVLG
jgi:hypothetical protein